MQSEVSPRATVLVCRLIGLVFFGASSALSQTVTCSFPNAKLPYPKTVTFRELEGTDEIMVGDSLREEMGVRPSRAAFDREVNGWKRYEWKVDHFSPKIDARSSVYMKEGISYRFAVEATSGAAKLSAVRRWVGNTGFQASVVGRCQ